MIIGIDATRANGAEKTGVGWYAWHVIQEMKKIKTDNVQFVLYSRKPLMGELAELPEGWKSKVLRWPPKRLWTQVRLSWEMLVHKPDVLFVPAHVFPLIYPKKTFMTIHDIAAARFPTSYTWFERWYSLWSAKRALTSLSSIFVPSNVVKEDLIDRYGSANSKKIHVTHLGHNASVTNDSSVLKKYDISKPFFMSVSRLEEKKNTKGIIKAFDVFCKTQQTHQLVLIGRPGHGYTEVARAIQESPNKDRIIFPVEKNGRASMQEVYNIMGHADAMVYPSLYEGFGIPILEAFACATPVITSNVGSMPEVGGDACMFVDPQDIDSIGVAMTRVVSDAALANDLREKGKERVQQFSWERCAKQTLKIILS